MQPFTLAIAHDPSTATPPFSATLGRITTLLGANGAGKSKLLAAIMQTAQGQVGPERILQLLPMQQLGNHEFKQSVVLSEAQRQLNELTHSYRHSPSHPQRFVVYEQHVLQYLRALDLELDRVEREAYHKHRQDPVNNPNPGYRKTSLEQLCDIFNAVVDVTLTWNESNGRFEAKSNRYASQPYTIDKLSSGEQWIFRSLPAFIKYKDDPMFVVVDEPETQLNEQLAVDFWSYIEAQRSNWTFVYATHSVSFAARQSIDGLYLLRSPASAPQCITDISELSREDKRLLLGVGPRLALAGKALFVEGQDQSVDVPFYRAVLGDDDTLITSVGGATAVHSATAQTGYWDKLQLGQMTIRGLTDRDFVMTSPPLNVTTLDLHDLEAYLCLPSLLVAMAQHTAGNTDLKLYSDLIVAHCRDERNAAIFKQTDRLFPASDTISLLKAERPLATTAEISAAYCKRRDLLFSGATARFSNDHITLSVDRIVAAIDRALDAAEVNTLLIWFSGKPLFGKLGKEAGLRDKLQAIRMLTLHGLVDTNNELRQLRLKLRALFAASTHQVQELP